MKDSKQSPVERIFEQFNLLSDAEFKSWMLNQLDNLHEAERKILIEEYTKGKKDGKRLTTTSTLVRGK